MVIRQLIVRKPGEPVKITGDRPVQHLRYAIGSLIGITLTFYLTVNLKTVDCRNPAPIPAMLGKSIRDLFEFLGGGEGVGGVLVDGFQVGARQCLD